MATKNTINNTYLTQPEIINTPGGGNTTVQYNKNGQFAGDTGLRYNNTLKELTVQGNIHVGGRVKGKIYTNVFNFFLQGGNSGQVLSTDGTGNLSWVDNSGGNGSNYSNSNVASYLSTFTGNVAAGNIKTDNLLHANGTAWDLNGTYANTNVANYLPAYSGDLSPTNIHITTNSLLGDNSTPNEYYLYRDVNQVSIGQTAAQTINIDSNGITLAGTTGVTIQGVAGSNITLGGGTTGNVVFPNGIKFNDGTIQTTAYNGAAVGTGNITFTDTTITSQVGDIIIGAAQTASPAPGFYKFASDGSLEFPNNAKQITNDSVPCIANADTVVYTSTSQWQHTIKILFKVEGTETTGWDTQSCEMMVAKSFRNDLVVGSVYGLVYTSTNPLATFTTRWNASISRVEVLCRPTSTTNNVAVRSFVTEMTTSD